MVIRRVRGAFGNKRTLRGAGLGVNVRFVGTAPRRALTLTYRTGRLPRGFRPRVAHVTSDGAWSFRTARVDELVGLLAGVGSKGQPRRL